jgi:hypothetical protein
VDKAEPGGWIALYVWPAGDGFHFVFQAVDASNWCIQDASAEPLAADWISAIGRTHLLARGGIPTLIELNAGIAAQLEGWRVEVRDSLAARADWPREAAARGVP